MKKLLLLLPMLLLGGCETFKVCEQWEESIIHHPAEANYSYVKSYWTGLPTKVYAGETPAWDEVVKTCVSYENTP